MKGDRVKVIGVAGEGTVLEDQGIYANVKVQWDGDRSAFTSNPLGINLRHIEAEPPTTELSKDTLSAIYLIEKEKDELVKERNSINSRIVQMEEAVKLLRGWK
jgi:hypothetical protein